MAKATGILSLGTRKDATTWERGCQALGFSVSTPLKKPAPTLEELEAFFADQPEWVFFAGHFNDLRLWNQAHQDSRRRDEVIITFAADKVRAERDRASKVFAKTSGAFALHKNCRLVLWGGCDTFGSRDTLRTLRSLFGAHLLLGFLGSTGWRVVDAMLGGGFIKKGHFFERVRGRHDDPVEIRNAWMHTARVGYGGGKMESIFRALDPNGQEWVLQGGRVLKGRKVS